MSTKVTNGLNLTGTKITNLGNGTDPADAVNKGQLDAAIEGLKWKAPVKAATTANIALSGEQTIDAVSILAGDRVLAKDQSAGAANGIYVAAAGAWTRATDFDAASEVEGAAVFVSQGSTNGNSRWNMTTPGPIVIGTTPLVWTQTGGGTSYTAGDGIDISGGVISVDSDVVPGKYSATIGDGVATTITVTHNLNTKDVVVSVREVSGDAMVIADVVANSANTVQITFATAPTTGQYRATVVG